MEKAARGSQQFGNMKFMKNIQRRQICILNFAAEFFQKNFAGKLSFHSTEAVE